MDVNDFGDVLLLWCIADRDICCILGSIVIAFCCDSCISQECLFYWLLITCVLTLVLTCDANCSNFHKRIDFKFDNIL